MNFSIANRGSSFALFHEKKKTKPTKQKTAASSVLPAFTCASQVLNYMTGHINLPMYLHGHPAKQAELKSAVLERLRAVLLK